MHQDSKLEIITLQNKHWRYLQAYNNIESTNLSLQFIRRIFCSYSKLPPAVTANVLTE